MSNDERRSAPANAARSSFLLMAGSVLSAALWICLIWVVYLKLPTYKRLFDDFETDVGPLTVIVLNYAGPILPLIGIASGACLTANRFKRMRAFMLFWLPLILIAGLVITVGLPYPNLLNDLE